MYHSHSKLEQSTRTDGHTFQTGIGATLVAHGVKINEI